MSKLENVGANSLIMKNNAGLAWLYKRGVTEDTVKEFGLSYCNYSNHISPNLPEGFDSYLENYFKGSVLVPLNDLLKWSGRNSNWRFNKRFYELRVAHYFNLRNYEWDAIENEDDKAEMIAFYNTENKILSYDAHLRELEAKSKRKKK